MSVYIGKYKSRRSKKGEITPKGFVETFTSDELDENRKEEIKSRLEQKFATHSELSDSWEMQGINTYCVGEFPNDSLVRIYTSEGRVLVEVKGVVADPLAEKIQEDLWNDKELRTNSTNYW
ncbi:hypothetical protein CMI38_04030 [Candidatus Pacearchaeota archaeon]|jgi:hypothetical protein|nr:hypothetical protein [Candidatus Pacearchaeota archaeon]|tara:strand:+ start:298 stop:660 length:363 start_codon:yes stop_codon:yes gene_type:complete